MWRELPLLEANPLEGIFSLHRHPNKHIIVHVIVTTNRVPHVKYTSKLNAKFKLITRNTNTPLSHIMYTEFIKL